MTNELRAPRPARLRPATLWHEAHRAGWGPLPELLLTLTLVTGLVDAVSILALSRVFVANMTGNVVFAGFAITGAPGFSLGASLFALAGFLTGAAAGGRLTARTGHDRALHLRAATTAEFGLLALALVIALTVGGAGAAHGTAHLAAGVVPVGPAAADALSAVLAVAMGIQNAAARSLAVPDLTTTVLTMTLTGLASDLRSGRRGRVTLARRVLVVAAMLAGGVAGAWLVLGAGVVVPLAIATALLGAAALVTHRAAGRPGQWRDARPATSSTGIPSALPSAPGRHPPPSGRPPRAPRSQHAPLPEPSRCVPGNAGPVRPWAHMVCRVTQTWIVEPSGPLRGDIVVRGSKNAVTKHMVAAMLGGGPSVIRNAPQVGDVDITAAMLESVGFQVERADGEITIGPGDEVWPRVPEAFTGLNRIPILMLGPLLHLTGEAFVPLVGGDPIGRRPVDFHVEALRSLGAEVEFGPTGITAKATRLHGARITLPYPSVGATETVLLSAVLAEGKTVLRNAATEPEVVELALFLQRMGAHIELSPDRRIVIEGVPALKPATTRLAGDRLEAFSYLVAGLITGGEVRVHGCPQDRLVTAITTLGRMGCQFDITDDWITASAPRGLEPAAVHTDTHPGFMTDWQQPLMVLFTQANGMSVLHETVFENRLVYVPALQKMGCEIEVFAACLGGPACRFADGNALHSAVIRGVSKLRGAEVELPDVRAGFSAVLAAAVADRPSVLHGVHHIERGYHQPFEKFASLGLRVTRATA